VEAARPRRPARLALTVRAAGGVVVRNAGSLEVLLVHRPRYDDWTFPKGKCAAEESDQLCALREVEEETGLRCDLGDEVASTAYRDGRGRPKVVRYWLMEPAGGAFMPSREVDESAWLSPEAAEQRLSYPRDRPVLRAAVAASRS
jgi:8-oxo-dGTP diphosphatase